MKKNLLTIDELLEDGDELWMQESPGYRELTKEELLLECYNYFNWCENTPINRNKAFGTGIIRYSSSRPYTWSGLILYIGFDFSEEYPDVADWTKGVITTQLTEGSLIGEFHHNLASKLLGLVEKKQVDENVSTTIEVVDNETKDELGKLIG